jgi:molybdate transport system substrate-binding protein
VFTLLSVRRVAAAVLLGLAVPAAGSCGTQDGPARPAAGSAEPSPTPAGTVTVFAASSLTGPFTRIAADFQAAHPGTRVRTSFGASSTLAAQIAAGAPADVFAAANGQTMARVVEAGAAAGAPVPFAANRLEVALPRNNPARIRRLADLARPGVRVALCAEQVPCGAAARQVLAAARVAVRPVTLEPDVKATLTKVRLGEVDAALVYRTDVLAARDEVTGVPFPEAARAVNDYPIAALSRGPNRTAADAFVAQVRSPAGRTVLAAAGFELR